MQWRNRRLSFTAALIALNAVIFVLIQFLPISGREVLVKWFALSREGVLHGAIWQFLTYQFLHETLLHLLVNMLAFWFVGRYMEAELGLRRFLVLYCVGGVVGGGLQLMFQDGGTELVGASAAVCSVLVGFCTLHPQERITALIFFVIPLQLRAKTLGWAIVLISLILAVINWPPGIGNLAHFGGSVCGFALIRWWQRRSHNWN